MALHCPKQDKIWPRPASDQLCVVLHNSFGVLIITYSLLHCGKKVNKFWVAWGWADNDRVLSLKQIICGRPKLNTFRQMEIMDNNPLSSKMFKRSNDQTILLVRFWLKLQQLNNQRSLNGENNFKITPPPKQWNFLIKQLRSDFILRSSSHY